MQPGYHIKRLGPHSFSCQKLGQISVRVYSKDNAEASIPPLLLSLSGDHGYRNNSISGAGGLFVFDSLFPGNFYLRPLLKVVNPFAPAFFSCTLPENDTTNLHVFFSGIFFQTFNAGNRTGFWGV